jgi:hypothetical protein
MSANDLVIAGIPVKTLRSKDFAADQGGGWQQSRGSAAKSFKNKDFLLHLETRQGKLFRLALFNFEGFEWHDGTQ